MITLFDVVVFASHIGLWTAWTLLIRASRKGATYDYSPYSVILNTEIAKFLLTVSYVFFVNKENGFLELKKIATKWRQGIYFAVPAFIYAIYNGLYYHNMTIFDPTSYRVLINQRILWSGLLFQAFFSVRLGWYKWGALVLLLFGCALNQVTEDFKLKVSHQDLTMMAIQAFCSSLGGVYNEYLLKKELDLETNAKNMYVYFFSILMNYCFVIYSDPLLVSPSQWYNHYNPTVFGLIFFGAVCGLSTALFLKYLNVLLKEYAHTGEMFLTAFLAYIFFGSPLNTRIMLSIVITTCSVLLYNRAPATPAPTEKEDLKETESSAKV